jgi:hypothetical protein
MKLLTYWVSPTYLELIIEMNGVTIKDHIYESDIESLQFDCDCLRETLSTYRKNLKKEKENKKN